MESREKPGLYLCLHRLKVEASGSMQMSGDWVFQNKIQTADFFPQSLLSGLGLETADFFPISSVSEQSLEQPISAPIAYRLRMVRSSRFTSQTPTDLAEFEAADFSSKPTDWPKSGSNRTFPLKPTEWPFRAADFSPQRQLSGQSLEAPISFPSAY